MLDWRLDLRFGVRLAPGSDLKHDLSIDLRLDQSLRLRLAILTVAVSFREALRIVHGLALVGAMVALTVDLAVGLLIQSHRTAFARFSRLAVFEDRVLDFHVFEPLELARADSSHARAGCRLLLHGISNNVPSVMVSCFRVRSKR